MSIDHLPYKSPLLTIDDAKILTSQLGYMPYNIIDIAARGTDGVPTVAFLYGLFQEKSCSTLSTKPKKPFPTIFWLTCQELKTRISKLEDEGHITLFQEKLNGDPEAIDMMQRAHELYIAERRDNLTPEDIAYVNGEKWGEHYHTCGIAGIVNFRSVKCLHCHAAHYLARPEHNNCIGRWTVELLEDNKES